ncbi:MAG: hypothetical protein H6Q43_345 [Deltaproteobacteria bacterium]|jgi:hypothetical protein|nr:hypothetical protein [Deltaproteobacteria bacterium]
MGNEEEKKGFTIRDRRISSPVAEAAKTETPEGEGGKGPRDQRETSPPEGVSLPEINFSSFVFSLSTSALLHLGEVADPITGKIEKDLPLAKQTIDILGMLQEKTRGNLTADEEKLLENLLADLRWRYVREVKG